MIEIFKCISILYAYDFSAFCFILILSKQNKFKNLKQICENITLKFFLPEYTYYLKKGITENNVPLTKIFI